MLFGFKENKGKKEVVSKEEYDAKVAEINTNLEATNEAVENNTNAINLINTWIDEQLFKNYEVIATNAGTYEIDIDKYRALYIFNCYNGVVAEDTKILGGSLCTIPILKTGVGVANSYVNNTGDAINYYWAEISYKDGVLTVTGSTENNMYPCVYGIA